MNPNVQDAIFRLTYSTKTRKRDYSLFQVAEDLNFLKEQLGGIGKVSKEVNVSTSMLSKFLSVYKVSTPIQNLIQERKIDSVSIVYYLSQFEPSDQQYLADLFLKKKITSHDLRILLPLRRQFINEDLDLLIDRIHNSKDKKVSVIKFPEVDLQKPISILKNQIEEIIQPKELLELSCDGSICNLKITREGEKQLRSYSKQKNLTLQELILKIIK